MHLNNFSEPALLTQTIYRDMESQEVSNLIFNELQQVQDNNKCFD